MTLPKKDRLLAPKLCEHCAAGKHRAYCVTYPTPCEDLVGIYNDGYADACAALAAESAQLRNVLEGICGEFERAVKHAEWRAASSKGMGVPFHGDFAMATQIPSQVDRMRWWAREMRRVLGATVVEPEPRESDK